MNKVLIASALACTASVVLLTSTTSGSARISGETEVRRWNMCDWRMIPEDTLVRIMQRSDYDDIRRRMFDSCPEAALSLTDQPTATISDTGGNEDNTGREADSNDPSPDRDPSPQNDPAPESEPPAPEALPG